MNVTSEGMFTDERGNEWRICARADFWEDQVRIEIIQNDDGECDIYSTWTPDDMATPHLEKENVRNFGRALDLAPDIAMDVYARMKE